MRTLSQPENVGKHITVRQGYYKHLLVVFILKWLIMEILPTIDYVFSVLRV